MKFKVAIPSLSRADRIGVHPLLSVGTVVVPASQAAAYRSAIGDRCAAIVEHPDVRGIAATRNWILDNVVDGDDFVFMCDDDLQEVRYLFSHRVIRPKRVDHLLSIVEHAARLAADAGTNVFGFARTPRPQERNVTLPFTLRRTVDAAAMGVFDTGQRFDENLTTSEDIDFCLETILKYKFLIEDMRYCWVFDRWTSGGLAEQQTSDAMEQSHRYLIRKWGRGIVQVNKKRRATGQAVSIHIT